MPVTRTFAGSVKKFPEAPVGGLQDHLLESPLASPDYTRNKDEVMAFLVGLTRDRRLGQLLSNRAVVLEFEKQQKLNAKQMDWHESCLGAGAIPLPTLRGFSGEEFCVLKVAPNYRASAPGNDLLLLEVIRIDPTTGKETKLPERLPKSIEDPGNPDLTAADVLTHRKHYPGISGRFHPGAMTIVGDGYTAAKVREVVEQRKRELHYLEKTMAYKKAEDDFMTGLIGSDTDLQRTAMNEWIDVLLRDRYLEELLTNPRIVQQDASWSRLVVPIKPQRNAKEAHTTYEIIVEPRTKLSETDEQRSGIRMVCRTRPPGGSESTEEITDRKAIIDRLYTGNIGLPEFKKAVDMAWGRKDQEAKRF